MKTFITILILVFGISTLQSQNLIQLDEAKVGFNLLAEIPGDTKQISVKISENFPGEFEKDALAFVKANFDISPYLIESPDREFDVYEVVFRSKKGHLSANFNKEGNLIKTSQKFKNIVLPITLVRKVYNENKGWSMVKNRYAASGKFDKIDNATYKITIIKGKQKKNLKFELNPSTNSNIVAVN